jgi:L-alanine-DL-glutamate epimerase-like enolase superfamily enzyme
VEHFLQRETEVFQFAKIRVGCGLQSVDDAIARAVKILRSIPSSMRVGVDAGQQVFLPPERRWPIEDAMRLNDVLASHGDFFLEDPLLIHDIEGYRILTRQNATPIAGGEMFVEVEAFAQYLSKEALHIAQPDAYVLAGTAACLQVDELAMRYGRKTVMHGWAGPVAQMQNIHAAMAMRSCDLVEWCTLEHPLLRDTLSPLWQFSGGRLKAPSLPGLGLVLDDDFQERYPFSDTSRLIA